MSFMEKWNHAFALTPEPSVDGTGLPSILEKFAEKVVQRRMETPAILFLEMVRPLNFLGSQLVFAAVPVAGIFASEAELTEMAAALEHRDAIAKLVRRIEALSGRRSS